MKALAEALSFFQGEVKDAPKDCTNPFFNSKYASLESVLSTVRPLLAKHGLSVTQLTDYSVEHKLMLLRTRIMHKSGEFIEGAYPIFGKDNSPQATGSALSYAKRYAIQAALGISSEDDDSEVAEGRGMASHHKPQVSQTEHVKTQNKGIPTATRGGVSEAQLKRLYAIRKKSNWSEDDIKQQLAKIGLKDEKELNYVQYEHLCKVIETVPKEGNKTVLHKTGTASTTQSDEYPF